LRGGAEGGGGVRGGGGGGVALREVWQRREGEGEGVEVAVG